MGQKLKALWLAEAVRLTEQQMGVFADGQINRQVRKEGGNLTQRILRRSHLLAEQHGLLAAQLASGRSAFYALLVLVVVALFSGVGLALGALSVTPINIFWALSFLLGLHFFSLFLWGISFIYSLNGAQSLMGQCWLWLAERFNKQAKQLQVFPALIHLLQQKKMLRWLIGLITNGLWIITLTTALVTLIFLFSLKHYSFVWQTTLLNSHDFVQLTHGLGAFPALLGFPLPDSEIILQSGYYAEESEAIRHAWALWLIGVFVCYGLVIRLVMFGLCCIVWWVNYCRIKLDLTLPEYQRLAEKLQPTQEQTGIVDKNNYIHIKQLITRELQQATGKALVGLEIDSLPMLLDVPQVKSLGIIADRGQRKAVLDLLYQQPVQSLLVVCDSARIPDRGLTELINELSLNAEQIRVMLIGYGEHYQNWLQQLQKLNIAQGDYAWLEEQNG